MKKYFTPEKLNSFDSEKKLRILYELALYIESEQASVESDHFQKLKEYHLNLALDKHERIQKINKEFFKIKSLDYQFQIYLMNLERFLGQSKKDYDFLIRTNDSEKKSESLAISCVLDSVRSAHNVGSFFRNSECFNSKHLYLCGLTPTPQLAQVKKTAMNCDENINWSYHKSAIELIKDLKKQNYEIWSVETAKKATHIHEVIQRPEKLILIFGHEQFGISLELLELSDKFIDINLKGIKNSLNVSVSQAVVLNHLTNL